MAGCAFPGLDLAREWLVFAGQIEQAVQDEGGPREAADLTSHAAKLFLTVRNGADGTDARAEFLDSLARLQLPEDAACFRIPEGFAWYALYPERYADAAECWAEQHRPARVLVIGLRSIGTSLSAVVAAVLARTGCEVTERLTVRPGGHPFERQASITISGKLPDAAIIVDEGPGLSGSSMAGVAEALVRCGVPHEAITFFPGHGNGPGGEANAEVRRWWTRGRCWVGAQDKSVLPSLEDVQWQFAGFAAVNDDLETRAAMKRRRQARLAEKGFALPSPAEGAGWIALANEGQGPSRELATEDFLCGRLAPYIATAAFAPADERVIPDGLQRIVAALHDCPGLAAAEDRVLAGCLGLPLAGDGRLAPREWMTLRDGRIIKRDATGADCEHDWAGPQTVLWDVAGAVIEWDLRDAVRERFLRCLAERHGISASTKALALHEAGYSSLHLARAQHRGDGADSARYEASLRGAAARLEVGE